MSMTTLLNDLADWIQATIEHGVHLDAGLLACLESTFGTAAPERLLADPDEGEAASFLELIFTPDAAVKDTYEACWGNQPFSPAAVREVAENLARRQVSSLLYLPDRERPMHLVVPPLALAAFVQGLNIAWQPPQGLADVLTERLNDSRRYRVQALLRHARVNWQNHRVQLMDLFLSRVAPAAGEFEGDLLFMCSLLNEFEPAQSGFDFLMARKHSYFQALCKAEAFERRLQAGTMELLMLQGARAAYGDVAQWRAWMRQVDRIGMALFGNTLYFKEPLVADLSAEG